MQNNLIDHLETRLGKIHAGWTRDPSGRELPFQVAEFRNGQLEGAVSFATLGLGRHGLSMPQGRRKLHLELTMTTHAALAPGRIPQALQHVGLSLLGSHEAILRGQTFRLPWPLVDGGCSILYSAVPGYFDEDFDVVELEDGTRVAIAWLVPITEPEGYFIGKHGWDSFEQLLVEKDPDLLDPTRNASVVSG
jgi:Suppressor of fused protein (SUFU)